MAFVVMPRGIFGQTPAQAAPAPRLRRHAASIRLWVHPPAGVEIRLQKERGRDAVPPLPAFASARPGFDQSAFRRGGRKPLIPQLHRHRYLPAKARREGLGVLRGRAQRTVHVARPADHDAADAVTPAQIRDLPDGAALT